MAIDSRNKRASAGSLLGLELLPLADGTVGVPDRLQVAGLYAGIAAAMPLVIVYGPFWLDAGGHYIPGAVCFGEHVPGAVAWGEFAAGPAKVEARGT